MSRRDRAHVLTALERLGADDPARGVPRAAIAEHIGRVRDDMRTLLDLQALVAQGHVAALPDDRWALTPEGLAWLAQDHELSG